MRQTTVKDLLQKAIGYLLADRFLVLLLAD